MQSCLNCYNSWMCKTRSPKFYEEHLKNDTTCRKWEDDSVDWDEEGEE